MIQVTKMTQISKLTQLGQIIQIPFPTLKVRKHHERCRLPGKMLTTWSCAKPMVLKHVGTSGSSGPVPVASPERNSSLSPPTSTKAALVPETEATSMPSNSVVDSILEKRKMRKRVHVRELDKRPPKRKQG